MANRGLKAYQENHFEVAEELFLNALKAGVTVRSPESLQTLLANIYKKSGDHKKAIVYLRKALESNPNYETAWVNLGIIHRQLGQLDEAEKCYKNAERIAPEDPYLMTSLGALYFHRKEPQKGINYFKKSIELEPDLNTSYGNLAYAYLSLGQADKASHWLEEAKKRGYPNADVIEGKLKKLQKRQRRR